MKHSPFFLILVLLIAQVASLVEAQTLFFGADVPEFEGYVPMPEESKLQFQHAKAQVFGGIAEVLALVPTSEVDHTVDNFSSVIALLQLQEPYFFPKFSIRIAANDSYQKLVQTLPKQFPDTAVETPIITDDYYIISAETKLVLPSGLWCEMLAITGLIRLNGHVCQIEASMKDNNLEHRNRFAEKVRLWLDMICSHNISPVATNRWEQEIENEEWTKSPFGTFAMPGNFEVRGRICGEMVDAATQTAHISTPEFVLQQWGLNEGKKEAFSHYVRMLQSELDLDLREYLSSPLGEDINLIGETNPIGLQLKTELGTSRLLEVEKAEMTFFGGRKSVKVIFRRQLDQNPPVRVILYLTPAGKHSIKTVFAYRISDVVDWASGIEVIEKSFAFENN